MLRSSIFELTWHLEPLGNDPTTRWKAALVAQTHSGPFSASEWLLLSALPLYASWSSPLFFLLSCAFSFEPLSSLRHCDPP
jgi:hypothetical protein